MIVDLLQPLSHQLARTHPQWVGHIRALIEDSAHPKAPAIVATLPDDA